MWILPLVASLLAALVSLGAQSDSRPSAAALTPVYVGTYTDGASRGIYRVDLDLSSGRASEPSLVGEATNPSFLAWHPTRDVLYAVSETNTLGPEKAGAVIAFTVGTGGGLTKIAEQSSGGAHPCYVSVHPDGT